jgi:hypothetical protein
MQARSLKFGMIVSYQKRLAIIIPKNKISRWRIQDGGFSISASFEYCYLNMQARSLKFGMIIGHHTRLTIIVSKNKKFKMADPKWRLFYQCELGI